MKKFKNRLIAVGLFCLCFAASGAEIVSEPNIRVIKENLHCSLETHLNSEIYGMLEKTNNVSSVLTFCSNYKSDLNEAIAGLKSMLGQKFSPEAKPIIVGALFTIKLRMALINAMQKKLIPYEKP